MIRLNLKLESKEVLEIINYQQNENEFYYIGQFTSSKYKQQQYWVKTTRKPIVNY